MTAAAAKLLADIRGRGAWLAADPSGTLNIKAPRGLLTEDLRAELAEHKADLLRLLRREAAGIPVMPETDAAIMDSVLEAFDGARLSCTGMLTRTPRMKMPRGPEPWGIWCAPIPEAPRPPPQAEVPPGPFESSGTTAPLDVAEALEEARVVYLTRLGIALDQDMPTEPGSPAERTAWPTAMIRSQPMPR